MVQKYRSKPKIKDVDEILKEAIDKILKENRVSSLKELAQRNFSDCVIQLEKEAHKIYKNEEQNYIKEFLKEKGVSETLAENLSPTISEFATTISNIRRARAGTTSEKILIEALRALDIPCEKCEIKRGGYRPDIVIPSNEVLKNNPEKGVAIAVKRTLRERWAEDIDIFKKFPNGKFVLITPEQDFKEEKVKDMIERGMKEIYIPDELYERNEFSKKYKEIKKMSELPKDLKKFLEKFK